VAATALFYVCFQERHVGQRRHAPREQPIYSRKDFKIMTNAKSADQQTRNSRGSCTSKGATIASLLLSMTLLFSQAAAAQTAATSPGMERLNAQMQNVTPAAAAEPNPNCTLIVPANPLSAAGLATPYQLVATDPRQGPCNEADSAQSAFVQAAIFDPATNTISIYNPLVINQGDKPWEQPVNITLPAGAIVATWFGFNAGDLTLRGASGNVLQDAKCVNGSGGTVFGQYAYCNAPAFFAAANAAIASGKLKVPAVGTAIDGKPCPTVRDFFVVDQDQSDNLTTLYMVSSLGHIAQLNARNKSRHPKGVPLGNASDNRLMDAFVAPAMGCKPWTAPDLADPGAMVPALALNELSARMGQVTPVAMIPAGNPMTQVNGNANLAKTNLYRLGVDQPTTASFNDVDTARYCRQLLRDAPERMLINRTALSAFASPDAGAANSLYTFLAQRFVSAYELLDCKNLVNQAVPVSVTVNGDGVATSASISAANLKNIVLKFSASHAQDNALDSSARSQLSKE
jgi:hypothetical protein